MEKMFLTIKEAAAYVGVSLPTMYAMSKIDGFPVVRLSERCTRVSIKKLNEWMEARGGTVAKT